MKQNRSITERQRDSNSENQEDKELLRTQRSGVPCSPVVSRIKVGETKAAVTLSFKMLLASRCSLRNTVSKFISY